MGNMSANKLGGLCLIIGPLLSLIFYMLQPGNMIIAFADTADASASLALPYRVMPWLRASVH